MIRPRTVLQRRRLERPGVRHVMRPFKAWCTWIDSDDSAPLFDGFSKWMCGIIAVLAFILIFVNAIRFIANH